MVGVLAHVLDHEPRRASEDVLNHFPRAARAYSRELVLHPVLVGLVEILQLQQAVPPLALDPGPDGFDGVEVG